MKTGRPVAAEGEHKVLWNGQLHPETIRRIKTIAFRKLVHAAAPVDVEHTEHVSEADIVTEAITAMPLPRKPTSEQIAAARQTLAGKKRAIKLIDDFEAISDEAAC